MARRTGGGNRLPALAVGVFVVVLAIAGWMVWSGRWPVAPDTPRLDMKLPTPPTLPKPIPMPDPQPAPLPIPGPKGG